MGLFIGFFAVILLSSGPAFWCNGCGEHGSLTGAMGNGWIFHKLFYSLQCCICQGLGWPGLCTLQGHSVIFLLLSGKKKSFLLFGSVSEVLRQMVKFMRKVGLGHSKEKWYFPCWLELRDSFNNRNIYVLA